MNVNRESWKVKKDLCSLNQTVGDKGNAVFYFYMKPKRALHYQHFYTTDLISYSDQS
jgi:hypothetical protein